MKIVKKWKKWIARSLQRKLIVSHVVVFLSTMVVLSIGYICVFVIERASNLPDELALLAERISFEIDGDLHARLEPVRATIHTEAYREIHNRVDTFIRTWMPQWDLSQGIAHYYTLVRTDRKGYARYVLSDRPDRCGVEYHYGRYPQMSAGLLGPTADFSPTRDEWGWWISGYAPVRKRSGEVVALFGIDISLFEAVRNLLMHSLIPPTIAICLGLVLAIALAQRRSGDIIQPLKALADAMNRVSHGDLEQSLETRQQDEIGQITRDFNRMIEALQSGERTRDLFGRYVSPQVMEKLLETPEGVRIEGETREVTILMVDIRGFTRMSATLPPSGIVTLLNEVFRNVVGAIRVHGGTVDKYIGDMVMAVFNAPLDLDDHACRAVAASLDIRDRLGDLNLDRAQRRQSLIDFVAVAHTGTVTAGSIGTPDRLSYTVIGQAVNVASRLEGVAKERGIPVLVSDSTWQMTHGAFVGEDLGVVNLRDHDIPMRIWRIEKATDSRLATSAESNQTAIS